MCSGQGWEEKRHKCKQTENKIQRGQPEFMKAAVHGETSHTAHIYMHGFTCLVRTAKFLRHKQELVVNTPQSLLKAACGRGGMTEEHVMGSRY